MLFSMVSNLFIFADYEILMTGDPGNDANFNAPQLWTGPFLGIGFYAFFVTFSMLYLTVSTFFIFANFGFGVIFGPALDMFCPIFNC